MKILMVAAVCVLAAAAAAPAPAPRARLPRSLSPAHHYNTYQSYDEPHTDEYYTVRAAPAQYELGARHVLTSARTHYRVQVPVTYEYSYESAPATSVHTYQPAAAHAHPHAHAHAYPIAYSSPTTDWQWDPAWC